jgi:hypothetical protein
MATPESTPKYPDVHVDIFDLYGDNALMVIGRVGKALRRAGHGDVVPEFNKEATSGDYDNVFATAEKWVDAS